jgi:hypothetical protein
LDTPAVIITESHVQTIAAMWKIVAARTDVSVKSGAAQGSRAVNAPLSPAARIGAVKVPSFKPFFFART